MEEIKTKSINLHVVLMTLSMFMTGASGMVVEYVLSTVSSYLNGTHIESFSLTIAVMLGMMGIGGFAQRFISDEGLIEKFVFLEIVLAVISALSPILVYAAFTYTPEHFQLVYYIFAMSIGFMVGFEIPFLTRANATYTKNLGDNLSIIFTADYIGAFFGALIWVYVLLPYMDIMQIGFVLAVLNFIVAMITYFYFKRGKKLRFGRSIIVLMVSVAGLLFWGSQNVVEWSKMIDQRLYNSPIVASKKTPYQQLTLTHDTVSNDTRLYINGKTQFSSLDEKRYHEFLVHTPIAMLQELPKRALVLGGGDGLAVRELRKYKGLSIDLVELDKDMYAWSKTNKKMTSINKDAFEGFVEHDLKNYYEMRNALRSSVAEDKYRVFFSDASNFVNAQTQIEKSASYDIVIIDLPDPYSLAINKMYTFQFYKRLQGIMKEGGVMVTQATSPFHAHPAFLTIGKTLKEAGFYTQPYWHNIPSFGEWGWWMASKKSLSLKGIKTDTEYVSDQLLESSFIFGKGVVNLEGVEANTLMRPVLVNLYNKDSWKVE